MLVALEPGTMTDNMPTAELHENKSTPVARERREI